MSNRLLSSGGAAASLTRRGWLDRLSSRIFLVSLALAALSFGVGVVGLVVGQPGLFSGDLDLGQALLTFVPGMGFAALAVVGLAYSLITPRGFKDPRRKSDIASKRNSPSGKLWRFVKWVWPWALLAGLGYWMYSDPEVLNVVLIIVTFVAQIVFALFYAIIQFVAIFWFMARSKVETIKPEDPKTVTFNDYWGQPTLLRLVKQWITLLSDREQFAKMGGKYINGILLYGPPGTGKTMLAKAMAGEVGIPFISIEGSGFRAMFWGVDVLKMIWFCGKAKKLAREYGACIAYIDEIDAVAMSRGGVMGGQTTMMGGMMGMGGSGSLTRLLYEMDGIGEQSRGEKIKARLYRLFGKTPPVRNWHVLYMGSTNRPDVLDPALLRPGRFDQKIVVDTPDRAGRREIIKGYLGKVKYDETVNVEAVVEDTPNATPAQIAAAITKDAVRIALFKGRERIAQQDIDLALQEQRMGIEQPIEEWDDEQRRQVAYHEAGHTVVQHYLMPEQRIVRVSIIRRSGSLGYMLPVDRIEVYTAPLRRFAADIMVAMAGHVATKLHMGEYWTGASSDFSMIRRNIWALYSLGYFGPPVRGWENGGASGIPANADPLIERFWKVLEDQTEQLLRQHAGEMEALTQALLEKSELSHDEVMALLGDNGWRDPRALNAPREPKRLPQPAPMPLPVPAAVVNESPTTTAMASAGGDGPDLLADTQPMRPVARMVPPPVPPAAQRSAGTEPKKVIHLPGSIARMAAGRAKSDSLGAEDASPESPPAPPVRKAAPKKNGQASKGGTGKGKKKK